MYNILTERLIRVDTSGGSRVEASLPEVYAALMADEVEAFPALRPHQRHAWHAFLVQLGAMALQKAGVTAPPVDASTWSDLIRGLTPEFPDDEPWQLVVDDITKPAFMQPPASSEDKGDEYKSGVETPDELDMLVTSKNHDVKSAVASSVQVDDWMFALVTLQTMEGYGGRRNYGISRMPSGYGNRPSFSITPSTRSGIHVQRDILALLEHRQVLFDEYQEYAITDGLCLLWTVAWDGTKAEVLSPKGLDIFYIEVCRRIRLQRTGRRLRAVRAGSASRRIIDVKGLTGDPWAPVGQSANKNQTPPAFLGLRKFGYERVVDGIFSSDWTQPHLLRPARFDRGRDGEMQLVARGMVRGEGGTAGYHERVIPLRQKAAQVFGSVDAKKMGDIAGERIKEIGIAKRILRHAIATFANRGEPDGIKSEIWDRANPWADKLDEILDAEFFIHLQTEYKEDGQSDRDRLRHNWLMNGNDGVVDHARALLQEATNSIPCLVIHQHRARARAESVFESSLHGSKGLPFLFPKAEEEDK